MTITSQPLQRRPLSHIARVRLAEEAYEARRAERSEPHRLLVAKVRAAHLGLAQAHASADREYERQNSLVPPPPGAAGLLHPSRAKAIAEFIAQEGWSTDSTAPVSPMQTKEEIAGTMIALAHADIEHAEAALREFEEERRQEAIRDSIALGVAIARGDALKAETGESKTAPTPVPARRAVKAVDLSQTLADD